jgi:deazaflavin-dependent oxidoreductase (nitroreductase family)
MLQVTETIQNLQVPPNQPHDRWVPKQDTRLQSCLESPCRRRRLEVIASYPGDAHQDTEAKLAPNLPDWMVEHANRHRSSGGADWHMCKMTQPGRPEITVPALLLTTTGRKSGERFIFPLFCGKAGDSYFVVASKGGAPQHPGWYRNIFANPEVDVQVGAAKMKARARTATGEERARL